MRRFRPSQARVFFDEPIYSHREISVRVGVFFEELIARVVGGKRVVVDGEPEGWHPDVATADRDIEVKAAGRERWWLRDHQLEQLPLVKDAELALVLYKCRRGLFSRCKSVQKLYAELAHEVQVWFIPGAAVTALLPFCKAGAAEKVRGLPVNLVKRLFAGQEKLSEIQVEPVRKVKKSISVCGVEVPEVTLWSGIKTQNAVDSIPF